ncbi:MAG: DUF5131 family protein [Ramlibacter sp.]|nr:DUF5131 family protein [Ramlibacter sp.]
MAEHTTIEWCHHTANLWWGCTEVHTGCDHCYARTFARAKGKADGWDGTRYATVSIWKDVLKWEAAAKAAGTTARVFVGSMMDIFEKSMPVADWKGTPLPGVETGHLRARYLREIVPATPNLQHLLLTKRPSNILKMVPPEWLAPGGWPANVMTGTSPVNQPTADTLIPQLLRVPGRHFLSMEPILGNIYIEDIKDPAGGVCLKPLAGLRWVGNGEGRCEAHALASRIDWVIAGGESGPKARPMHPDWVRSLRDQCAAAGVPFFFKQWGEYVPWERAEGSTDYPWASQRGHSRVQPPPKSVGLGIDGMREVIAELVGKKAAGRLLDGREWNGVPK